MCTSTQLDQALFRILLYGDNATELLLKTTPDGLRLPYVLAPAHTRVAEEITAAIKSSWNLQTYCLFPFSSDGPSPAPVRCQVVEICQPDADPPAGMRWLPVVSLTRNAFEDSADFAAIQSSLLTLDQYRQGKLPGVFGKPCWLRMVTEWVQTHATAAGLSLTGEFRQFNASPTFSLIRFKTHGPALWFKAVGEPNLCECRITLKLASVFPEFLPRILASRPAWNAWLSVESAGSSLDANSDKTSWTAAADSLALLQISSLSGRFELIHVGCRDLRPGSLLGMVDPFLDAMADLMEEQAKLNPAPLSRQELLSLGRDITSSLKELAECPIPNTLGHLDLNPGNLLVWGTHCVFLDWAEAYVGPPFFAFEYLLEQWRRFHHANPNQEQSLASSYATHWTRFASPREIAAALRIAPLLAAFAYAAGNSNWRNRESICPETARYLRSLVRRMKREADLLVEGSLPCIS